MTNTFKPGDVVNLKSGSPPLVVESISEGLVTVRYWQAGAENPTTPEMKCATLTCYPNLPAVLFEKFKTKRK